MAKSTAIRRWLLISLTIALTGLWYWWTTREQPIEVAVTAVERGTVEKTVANTRAGTVKACRRAKLSPSTGGQIAKLPVHEGEAVKQGQLLLELWNKDLTAQLDLARQEAASSASTARTLYRGRTGTPRGRPAAETACPQAGLRGAGRPGGVDRERR